MIEDKEVLYRWDEEIRDYVPVRKAKVKGFFVVKPASRKSQTVTPVPKDQVFWIIVTVLSAVSVIALGVIIFW